MSNSTEPNSKAHHEPTRLDVTCLQKFLFFACGTEC